MINLILCGGSGTRLWPLSRKENPKQFVKMFDNKSLYQLNLLRNRNICSSHFIVSNIAQYDLSSEQAESLGLYDLQYLLEPMGRNTAPAVTLACLNLNSEDIVLVTSSDHLIKDESAYIQAVRKAEKLAQEGFIVTFGLKPSYPETGFGYIETEDQENVVSFCEKPDLLTAEKYIRSGRYYWNSGMFCFKVSVFLEEIEKYAEDIYLKSNDAYESLESKCSNVIRIQSDDMKKIRSESIDYAVMEKSSKIKVVCADFNWSDVGSFDSLSCEFESDENDNSYSDNILTIDSKNNFILSKKNIVLLDVADLIIVEVNDSILITKKGASQKVKQVVDILNIKKPSIL